MPDVVIVGAGPAGIRAAETLAEYGLTPILIDEGRRAGGQGHRWLSAILDPAQVMGSEHRKYQQLHADFAALQPRIDYRPETLVWGIDQNGLQLLSQGRTEEIAADAVILATGAMDRIMPIRGWTLPGVYTLGGAQVALKDQACLIGRRVVFCGSSPLLALAAAQYLDHGADVVAVCDTTGLGAKIGSGPKLLGSTRTLLRGLGYLNTLRQRGVELLFGAEQMTVAGTDHVERLELVVSGRHRSFDCDAVALGFGLKPETQLADLLGARFVYDPGFRQWLPQTDTDGRAGGNLYLAGDGAAIGGADAAEASGRLAALAFLSDQGRAEAKRPMPALRREVARLRQFQRGLAKAFAWPEGAAAALDAEVPVCRCENVTAGEIRTAMDADLGPVDVNRIKAITRCGMGRCQGRVCGHALGELAAAHSNRPLADVGRLRGQAPVKPIALSAARSKAS